MTNDFVKFIETEALQLKVVSNIPFQQEISGLGSHTIAPPANKITELDNSSGREALIQELSKLKEQMAARESQSIQTLENELADEKRQKGEMQQKMLELETKLLRHPKSKVCIIF